jgi:hypothetical protein
LIWPFQGNIFGLTAVDAGFFGQFDIVGKWRTVGDAVSGGSTNTYTLPTSINRRLSSHSQQLEPV